MYTLGSLFDGIGGWPLAAVKCGIKPVWASEIEPFPAAVTAHWFPVHVHYRVRRLIPLECERLNGHPDGWTDIPLNGKPASDTARYKAEGNGMAQPCADFVIEGILRVLENERKGQHET